MQFFQLDKKQLYKRRINFTRQQKTDPEITFYPYFYDFLKKKSLH